MIKIEHVVTPAPDQMEFIIEGMRNPLNSWKRSDTVTFTDEHVFGVGPNDEKLMAQLCIAGPEHRKFMRMMTVYARITAPLYWWKEFDTYKVGTVSNSCSTMHKIGEKEFTLDDFSYERLGVYVPAEENDGEKCFQNLWYENMKTTIQSLNVARVYYIRTNSPNLKREYWWQMIQLLPSSYNQTRNVMMNYEVLRTMVGQRSNHKLTEWIDFCKWATKLPHGWLMEIESITGEV